MTAPADAGRRLHRGLRRTAQVVARVARRGNSGVQRAADGVVRRTLGLDDYLSASVDSNRRLLDALNRIEEVLRDRDNEIEELRRQLRDRQR